MNGRVSSSVELFSDLRTDGNQQTGTMVLDEPILQNGELG